MDCRKTASAGLVAVATAVACENVRLAGLATVGTSAPQALHSVGDTLVVAWIFRIADVLSCQSAGPLLREVQKYEGDRVAIRVIAIGDASELVQDYFRVQRIRAQVRYVPGASFREGFGDLKLPALFLVRDGVVRGIWTGSSTVAKLAEGDPPRIVRLLESLIVEPRVDVGQETERR